jgi:hypothetical protein
MQIIGGGGLGAVSAGVSESLVLLVVLVLAIVLWKVAKIIWAALSH